MPYDCAFALINERLPLLVVKCSAISRRVFPALRTHRSLREPLPQFRCHHLALATQLALAQKALFLRFSFSFPSLIPSPILPTDEREKTERTPTQLLANKKCCLLIFAIAIGCLVLAAIPARNLRLFFVHYPENILGYPCVPSPVMLLPVVWQITSSLSSHLRSPSSWLSCSAGSPKRSWRFGVLVAVPPARILVTASYLFIVPNYSGISRSASTANVTIPHPETGLVLAAIPASKSTIYKNSS